MGIRGTIRTAVMISALAIGGACAANPRPRTDVEYVARRPPAERVEVVPAAPGAAYVWVRGHWGWRQNDYEWIGGHWAIPDRGFRQWVPGRWEQDRNGWYYREGHWR
jgi:hypothetical protein